MGITPDLPEWVPHEIGGWTHEPEPYNGAAWFGDDHRVSVLVREGMGDPFATVRDERVSHSRTYIIESEDNDDLETFEDVLEAAVEWMEDTDPSQWAHPDVDEAVFDVPEGFTLDIYSIGRKASIRYAIDDVPADLRGVTIRINGYPSTDNWTLALARPTITQGHEEELVDAEKGTPLVEMLAKAHRLATALRSNPPALTGAEYGELTYASLVGTKAEKVHPGSHAGLEVA